MTLATLLLTQSLVSSMLISMNNSNSAGTALVILYKLVDIYILLVDNNYAKYL